MKSRRYVFNWDFIGDIQKGRPNLGNSVSIEAYRLFLYTMRDHCCPAKHPILIG